MPAERHPNTPPLSLRRRHPHDESEAAVGTIHATDGHGDVRGRERRASNQTRVSDRRVCFSQKRRSATAPKADGGGSDDGRKNMAQRGPQDANGTRRRPDGTNGPGASSTMPAPPAATPAPPAATPAPPVATPAPPAATPAPERFQLTGTKADLSEAWELGRWQAAQ